MKCLTQTRLLELALLSGDRNFRSLLKSHGFGGTAAKPLQNTVSGHKKTVRFYVSGLVQGVGYRYFVHRAAQQLGIAGYVKNLNDGRVEVFAIGAEEQLHALQADLRRGPQGAMVEDVAETVADLLKEFESDFSIEHDY